MAHRHPDYPCFTREVCKRGILREPFRLIDVGVRGGIADHWLSFGDYLEAWGFDVLYEEGVGPLIEANDHPERLHYLNIGLGDIDGTRAFKFYPENPSSSHYAASNASHGVDDSWQNVPIRRLDSLYANNTIGPIDFMKMDAESYEIEIVRGGQLFFLESGIFGLESETTFLRTKRNPRSHFVELYEQLASYGFETYDVGLHRVPRRPLIHGFPEEIHGGEYVLRPVGAARVFDFLFLNDIFADPIKQKQSEVDRLIKMIAVAEIYYLNDVALDILFANRERLGSRFDVDEGANWLVRQRGDAKLTYEQYLTIAKSYDGSEGLVPKPSTAKGQFDEMRTLLVKQKQLIREKDVLLSLQESRLVEKATALNAIRNSRSWRMTAPLRKVMEWLR